MSQPLSLGFISPSPLDHGVNSPYKIPLGGSESALCYLAIELAKIGHLITLYSPYSTTFNLNNISHLPIDALSKPSPHHFLILLNKPALANRIQPFLSPKTQLVLWTQHHTDQPASKILAQKACRRLFKAFLFVSYWQQENYIHTFRLPRTKCFILRNALSPAFEHLFTTNDSILSHKTSPPSLAYTSVPYRGLELLLQFFPQIQQQIPNVTLQVFSSMRSHVFINQKDKHTYDYLYDLCRQTPGVIYHGSIPQLKLASLLKSVLALVYPCTFPETSCIAALEAMAAGCQVITTNYAALPETTAGFATLLPRYKNPLTTNRQFTNTTVDIINQFLTRDNQNLENHLHKQITFCHLCNLWSQRALQWQQTLNNLLY